MMVEGVRSAPAGLTGASKNTVAKLLVDIGTACDACLERNLRSRPCKRTQCDKLWCFVYAKEKNG